MFVLATTFNGQVQYYNGKAGPGWANCLGAKAEAFTYGREAADRTRAQFNSRTMLSGLTFTVEAV